MAVSVASFQKNLSACAQWLSLSIRESLREWKEALPVYVFVLALYVVFFMVIPSAGSSDASLRALKESAPEMEKIGGFFRRAQDWLSRALETIRGLTPEKLLGILKEFPRNTLDTLRRIPAHIGNFLSNFSKLVKLQWATLKGMLRQFWPPRLAWMRLKGFAEIHRPQIQKLTQSVAGCLMSFCALKLFALVVVPILGLGAVVILGIDISIAVFFVLQQAVSRGGKWIGEHLHGQAEAWWRRRAEEQQGAYRAAMGRLEGIRGKLQHPFQQVGSNLENKRTEGRKQYDEILENFRLAKEGAAHP